MAELAGDQFTEDDRAEFGQAVSEALAHINDRTFRSRMQELVDVAEHSVPGITDSFKDWPGTVVKVRNTLAHHGTPSLGGEFEAFIDLLIAIKHSLRWVLRTVLLDRAGIDPSTIQDGYKDSSAYGFHLANVKQHLLEVRIGMWLSSSDPGLVWLRPFSWCFVRSPARRRSMVAVDVCPAAPRCRRRCPTRRSGVARRPDRARSEPAAYPPCIPNTAQQNTNAATTFDPYFGGRGRGVRTSAGRNVALSALRAWLRCQPLVAHSSSAGFVPSPPCPPARSGSRSSSSQPCARPTSIPSSGPIQRSIHRRVGTPYARIFDESTRSRATNPDLN